jgi:branched-chain amino acid transport system ATP-binding protein
VSALLEVDRIEVRYGAVAAVRDVSLTVNAGEIVVLLGANGAGKTTTLRTISGLTRARHGSIRFEGDDISKARPDAIARRGIAHVPTGRGIFPTLSVEDNLRMALYGCGSSETARVDDVTAQFPILGQMRKRPAGELSGGQQQQLAIARALAQRPRLLLIDEMSMGLAPAVVGDLFEIVSGLRDTGVGVLMVEQFVAEALRVADRALVLEQGRVVASGATAELRGDAVAAAYLGGVHADVTVAPPPPTATEDLTVALPGSTVRTLEGLVAQRGGRVEDVVTDAVQRLIDEAGS